MVRERVREGGRVRRRGQREGLGVKGGRGPD
jgi:hypothetical protein